MNAAAWLADLTGDATTAHALYTRGADVLPMRKALGEGVNATGGAVVPEQVAAFVLAYRDRAIFRLECQRLSDGIRLIDCSAPYWRCIDCIHRRKPAVRGIERGVRCCDVYGEKVGSFRQVQQ